MDQCKWVAHLIKLFRRYCKQTRRNPVAKLLILPSDRGNDGLSVAEDGQSLLQDITGILVFWVCLSSCLQLFQSEDEDIWLEWLMINLSRINKTHTSSYNILLPAHGKQVHDEKYMNHWTGSFSCTIMRTKIQNSKNVFITMTNRTMLSAIFLGSRGSGLVLSSVTSLSLFWHFGAEIDDDKNLLLSKNPFNWIEEFPRDQSLQSLSWFLIG